MPISPSPLSDILRFISDYWVILLIIVVWVLRMIGSAARSLRPPSAGPRPIPRPMAPPAAPPTPRPTTLPRPQQATQAGGQRFRPQSPGRPASPAPARTGSASEQMAQERADVERFAAEEQDLERSVPEALGTPLTSAPSNTAPAGTFFDPNGPLAGQGAGPSLLRAIVLAEALGRPRIGAARGMRRPSVDRP